MSTEQKINRHFKIVFEPKEDWYGIGSLVQMYGITDRGFRRWAVGAGRLSHYIGESNAQVALEKANESTDDKYQKKFRTQGKVSFYAY